MKRWCELIEMNFGILAILSTPLHPSLQDGIRENRLHGLKPVTTIASPFGTIRRAFTLVELLVVIGIIAIMTSMMLGAFGKARQAADRTACLSNLRQVHQAFHLYAMSNGGQVPLGHRTVSKQFNSMVFSTTAGGRWVLFGLLAQQGLFRQPAVLYCPAENNPKFQYNTPENPWPATPLVPTENIQAGYAARPEQEIADDPTVALNAAFPKLEKFRNRAIFADLTAARNRVIARHRSGVNVLFGDGAARWIPLSAFDQADANWPEPAFPPSGAFNTTIDKVWSSFDRN